MGQITALTTQKRNPNRVNVYLDGEFAFGLAAITAVSLRIGQTLTPEQIEQLLTKDQQEMAKQAAIRFIEYRPRSVAETHKKLREKGFDEPAIEEALNRLQEVGLLDDLQFARYWVEQRETFKPRSHLALQQELRQKGIDANIIDQALMDVDEEASARKAAEQKVRSFHQLDEDSFKKKLMGFLQRRGFSYTIIRDVTDEMWERHMSDKSTY